MLKGLKFTVKEVRRYNKVHSEETQGEMKAFDVLVQGLLQLDLDALVSLVVLGMQTSEEKAEELVQGILDEGKDIIDIADGLKAVITSQGFTPWAKKLSIRAEFEKAMNQAVAQTEETQTEEVVNQ